MQHRNSARCPVRPRAGLVAGGHRGQAARRPPLLLAGDPAAAHGDDAVGQRDRELGLVRGQQHRSAVGHRLADQLAEEFARGRIEAGVRLVEQPERGPAGQQRGQGDPAALAGREPAGGGGAQAAGQADPDQGGVGRSAGRPSARTAKRTFSAAVSSS